MRKPKFGAAVVLGVLLTSAGGALGTDVQGVQFADRAASGEVVVGAYRGSIGVIDYDNDGWMDLFINDNGGLPKRLLHNVPNIVKPGGREFVDVTTSAGFASDSDSIARGGQAVVAFDYNNDGWPDIWTAGTGTGGAGALHRNNRDGTFTNVTATAGVRVSGINPLCASAIDFDHDGFTDLFIASSGTGAANALTLLRNNGNGTFTSRPDLLPSVTFNGTTYAMAFTDYDHDGWEDALVLFNAGRPITLKNVANPAPAGGRRFIDATTASGFTFVGPAPMGIAIGDVNNDGWLDLAITDAATGTYYDNRAGTFVRTTPYSTFFGWGTFFLDADNDGRLDNFQAGSYGRAAVSWLLLNRETGYVDARAALNTPALASQQCARIDWDNDGREDILLVNPGVSISTLHNESTTSNAWVKVRLRGGEGVNLDAVGAVIRLTSSGPDGSRTQVREIALGTSYGASEDPRAHFGLGAGTQVDRVEVIWPRLGTLRQRTDIFNGPFTPGQILQFSPRAVCEGDFNRSGTVSVQDVFDFLSAWFAGDVEADLDRSGAVTTQDLLTYLSAFFAGCV